MKDYNNKHKRVIPRDFFNESKLLKCLGKLHLQLMHLQETERPFVIVQFDNESFNIKQDDGDGVLLQRGYFRPISGVYIPNYGRV